MPLRRVAQRGFSLIELVAVLIIIAILALFLFKTAIDYTEEAEKAAMVQVASSVRAALHLRMAGLLAMQHDEAIPQLAKQNPMEWLSDKPHIYKGAVYGVAPRELAPPRSWYYDSRVGELAYRPSRTRHLSFDQDNAENEIRFKVVIEEGLLPGAEKSGLRGMRRVELVTVTPYRWSIGDTSLPQ